MEYDYYDNGILNIKIIKESPKIRYNIFVSAIIICVICYLLLLVHINSFNFEYS